MQTCLPLLAVEAHMLTSPHTPSLIFWHPSYQLCQDWLRCWRGTLYVHALVNGNDLVSNAGVSKGTAQRDAHWDVSKGTSQRDAHWGVLKGTSQGDACWGVLKGTGIPARCPLRCVKRHRHPSEMPTEVCWKAHPREMPAEVC